MSKPNGQSGPILNQPAIEQVILTRQGLQLGFAAFQIIPPVLPGEKPAQVPLPNEVGVSIIGDTLASILSQAGPEAIMQAIFKALTVTAMSHVSVRHEDGTPKIVGADGRPA